MMNDLYEMIKNAPINSDAVQAVETKYRCVLPELLKHIVSYDSEDRFAGEYRLLALKEIINADVFLDISFTERKLIPIVDCFDNDFIAFDIMNNTWVKINIVDDCVFDNADVLCDFIT